MYSVMNFLRCSISVSVVLLMCITPAPVSADNVESWTYFTGTGPVTSMKADGDIVWCGSELGLVRWDTRDMTYRIYRVPDGLSYPYIMDIDITPNGDVWVATKKGGIARFDGSSWETYSTDNGLPYNYGLSVDVDADGIVWASVYMPAYEDRGGGLSRWDGNSWQSSKLSDSVDDERNVVKDTSITSDGNIWVVYGYSNRLALFNNEVWTMMDISEISHIVTDTDGILWIVKNDGLYRHNGELFDSIDIPEGFEADDFLEPVVGPDGRLWIVVNDGRVLSIDDDSLHVDYNDLTLESHLTAVTVGEDGALYGGTDDGSLAVYTDTGWEIQRQQEVIPSSIIHAVIEDRNGLIWVAGETGVYRYNGSSWEMVTKREDLPVLYPQSSYTLFFDTNNTPWIRGSGHTLSYYDDGDWVQLPVKKDIEILSAVPGNNGDIWFEGERTIIYHYQLDSETLSEFYPPATEVNLLKVDNSGALWLSAERSDGLTLLCFNNDVWQDFPSVTTVVNTAITGFDLDGDGSVWCSITDFGEGHYPFYKGYLYRKDYDSNDFDLLLSKPETLEAGEPATLTLREIDTVGRAWLTTSYFTDYTNYESYGTHYYGVIKYDGATEGLYNDFNGLLSNVVNDVHVDRSNAVWFATDKGLCKYGDIYTGVDKDETAPSPIPLITASPNPFNPMTTLSFTLPIEALTTLTVYNIAGQKVATLVSDVMASGAHSVVWDGRDTFGVTVASGVYIAQLISGTHTATAKLALVR